MNKVTDTVMPGVQRFVYRGWRSGEACSAYLHGSLLRYSGAIVYTNAGFTAPGKTFPIPDVPEYAAFCYGDMPAYVFADWLEENIADIPAGLLQLLRESDA